MGFRPVNGLSNEVMSGFHLTEVAEAERALLRANRIAG